MERQYVLALTCKHLDLLDEAIISLCTLYSIYARWCWYELKNAPTDVELWGEEVE